jgi:hypothetical protein
MNSLISSQWREVLRSMFLFVPKRKVGGEATCAVRGQSPVIQLGQLLEATGPGVGVAGAVRGRNPEVRPPE